MTSEDNSLLFGVIPSFLRKPEQVPCWYEAGETHTYTLLRKPVNLEELFKHQYRMAIWRENGTLTYLMPSEADDAPKTDGKMMALAFEEQRFTIFIAGKTHNAIAQTAAFFLELEEPTGSGSSLLMLRSCKDEEGFDFRAAQFQCLTRMFEVAPLRAVEFQFLVLSAAQSVVLASRPHPTRLELYDCIFDDGGTAFVDALQKRESSFGSLTLPWGTSLSDDNLRRLFQVDTLERLSICFLAPELALLPFSMKANSLNHSIDVSSLSGADLQSLNIVPSKLSVTMRCEGGTFPTELIISFFRRLADFSHFFELKFDFIFLHSNNMEIPDCVAQEFSRAILANCNLKVLDMCTTRNEWNSHVGTILKCLQDHKELRTLKNIFDSAFGPDFIYLRQLLSRNRNITVADEEGNTYSDDDLIDELYSLNRFYRGSANLRVQPPFERPLLVATAMVETASNDFQRSALLFADHGDALCELFQFA